LNAIRSRVADLLTSLEDFFDLHPHFCLFFLIAIYLPAAFAASRSAPLWHDELFTYYIAQSATLGQMWSSLRSHDLNPPLSYLLTRWSFDLFGVNTLATRVPEMCGFLLWMVCAFQFVRRRMGVCFAMFGVMVLLESDSFQFAADARPYALALGFLSLAMVGYQQVVGEFSLSASSRRRMGLCLVATGIIGMLLSHMMAILAIGGLAAAEAWRTWERRKLDGSVLAAILLPLTLLAAYLPMFRNHGSAIYPLAFQPDGETIFDFYIATVSRQMIALSLTALAVLVLLGPAHLRGGIPAYGKRWFFPGPEWVASIAMLGAPLILMARLMVSHGAFFPRYGAIATIGVIVLSSALLGRWTMDGRRPDGRAALVGAGILLLMSGLWRAIPLQLRAGNFIPTIANSEPPLKPCQACLETAAIDVSIPLVDASGLTFLEMNHQETPATLARVYYLTDEAASTRYAHANIFEPMPQLVTDFNLRGHAVEYDDFVRQHPHFFVLGRYDYPEDWLLRKLTAEKANIRVVGHVEDGYRDTELYEVTMPAQ
jgi:hypothetical protein